MLQSVVSNTLCLALQRVSYSKVQKDIFVPHIMLLALQRVWWRRQWRGTLGQAYQGRA